MATATACAKLAMRALTWVIGQQSKSLMSGAAGAQASSSAERMAAMLSGPDHSILKPAADAPALNCLHPSQLALGFQTLKVVQPAHRRRGLKASGRTDCRRPRCRGSRRGLRHRRSEPSAACRRATVPSVVGL